MCKIVIPVFERTMTVVDKVKRRLMQRFGEGTDTYERKVAPVAYDTVQHNRYKEQHQEVVVREDEQVEVRTILQPIVEDVFAPGDVIEDTDPLALEEVRFDPEGEDLERQHRAHAAVDALGTHHVVEEPLEVVTRDPVVHTQSRRHVVELVQPVVRRRVVRDHLTVRYRPRFERRTSVAIREVVEAPPVSMADWLRSEKA